VKQTRIRNNPTNGWGYVALGADIAGTLLPGATGGRIAVKIIENGGDVSKVVAKEIESVKSFTNKTPAIKQGSAGGPGAGKNFSSKTKSEIINSSKGCVYCGTTNGKMESDHRISKRNNGNNTLENGVKACQHCNRSKGAGDYPKSPPKDYKWTWPPPWWKK